MLKSMLQLALSFVLLSLLIPSYGFCGEPPTFKDLERKLSAVSSLRFKYSEHHTPTGHSVGTPPVPMVRDFEAHVSAARDGIYFTYSSTETGRPWKSSGTFISDGKFNWHYQKPGGAHNPSFVSKQPVGF